MLIKEIYILKSLHICVAFFIYIFNELIDFNELKKNLT